MPPMSPEHRHVAEIDALIDAYCHRLTTAVPLDAATYNNIISGRDELKQRIAEILKGV